MLVSDVSIMGPVFHEARQTWNLKSCECLRGEVPLGKFCFPCTLQMGCGIIPGTFTGGASKCWSGHVHRLAYVGGTERNHS